MADHLFKALAGLSNSGLWLIVEVASVLSSLKRQLLLASVWTHRRPATACGASLYEGHGMTGTFFLFMLFSIISSCKNCKKKKSISTKFQYFLLKVGKFQLLTYSRKKNIILIYFKIKNTLKNNQINFPGKRIQERNSQITVNYWMLGRWRERKLSVKLTSFAILAMTVITFYLIFRYIKLLGDLVTNTQMLLLCNIITLSLPISFKNIFYFKIHLFFYINMLKILKIINLIYFLIKHFFKMYSNSDWNAKIKTF